MDDADDSSPTISRSFDSIPADKMRELEREAAIRTREERLKTILSPMEGLVMNIQSLLVWEKPQPSAVMFVCANIVFWLAATTNQRLVFIAASLSFLLVCAETFRYRVWPNMRVKRREPREEEWTSLYERLLSVPELCEYISRAWQLVEDWHNAFWELRKRDPAKFCTYTCCVCLTVFFISVYIPGVILAYFVMVCLLLWPAFLFHDVTGQLYTKMKPFLKQFEQSMDSLERRERRQKRRRRSSRNHADGDSSTDSELNEFCPTPGPAVDAALFHAARVAGRSPSSSCQGTPTYGFVGGLLPRGASMEFTDDELNTDNESTNLLAGLSQMPSFQDRTLDPSGDELDSHSAGSLLQLGVQEQDSNRLHPPRDLLGISTDEDMADHELDTPESPLDDLSSGPIRTSQERSGSDAMAPNIDSSLAPAAAQLLSQTVASVVTEALTSWTDSVSREDTVQTRPKQRHHTLPVTSAQMTSSGAATASTTTIPSGLTPSPQSDLDLAEFEMLDSSELDNVSSPTTEDDVSPSSESSPGALNAGITYLSSFFTRRK
ncbi:reticulophagy regulator 3-like [Diadema setosum]|uniref:reticulophagy regulator 3-like n=1 Tax=Diadema setosum TaxID=31175 RepID=UPI003B3A9B7B